MPPDAISETGEPLTFIPHAPGFATSGSGHVYREDHPKRGRVWAAIKPTAEIEFDRTPGRHTIRRTGRYLFPVRWEDDTLGVVHWTPPPQPEQSQPAPPPAEDDDDIPF